MHIVVWTYVTDIIITTINKHNPTAMRAIIPNLWDIMKKLFVQIATEISIDQSAKIYTVITNNSWLKHACKKYTPNVLNAKRRREYY